MEYEGWKRAILRSHSVVLSELVDVFGSLACGWNEAEAGVAEVVAREVEVGV